MPEEKAEEKSVAAEKFSRERRMRLSRKRNPDFNFSETEEAYPAE